MTSEGGEWSTFGESPHFDRFVVARSQDTIGRIGEVNGSDRFLMSDKLAGMLGGNFISLQEFFTDRQAFNSLIISIHQFALKNACNLLLANCSEHILLAPIDLDHFVQHFLVKLHGSSALLWNVEDCHGCIVRCNGELLGVGWVEGDRSHRLAGNCNEMKKSHVKFEFHRQNSLSVINFLLRINIPSFRLME